MSRSTAVSGRPRAMRSMISNFASKRVQPMALPRRNCWVDSPWRQVACRGNQGSMVSSLTGTPCHFRRHAKIIEASRRDGAAHVLHEILVIGEIDFRQQHHAENFSRLDEVMQIGAGIIS